MRVFARSDFEAELLSAPPAPPTFVIGGSADPFYPPAHLKARIAIENPGVALTVLDCGHDPLHEVPREAALLVDGFLAAMQKR
jgi:pimeloyl-ACP methyl ester carboxylesterase